VSDTTVMPAPPKAQLKATSSMPAPTPRVNTAMPSPLERQLKVKAMRYSKGKKKGNIADLYTLTPPPEFFIDMARASLSACEALGERSKLPERIGARNYYDIPLNTHTPKLDKRFKATRSQEGGLAKGLIIRIRKMTDDELRQKYGRQKAPRLSPLEAIRQKLNILKTEDGVISCQISNLARYLPMDAVTRMKELRFDPMEELVRMYDEASAMLAREEERPKPTAIKIIALLNVKQKCATELMRYRYARVNEATVLQAKTVQGITIKLNSKRNELVAASTPMPKPRSSMSEVELAADDTRREDLGLEPLPNNHEDDIVDGQYEVMT
jgi:hypothetical protein